MKISGDKSDLSISQAGAGTAAQQCEDIYKHLPTAKLPGLFENMDSSHNGDLTAPATEDGTEGSSSVITQNEGSSQTATKTEDTDSKAMEIVESQNLAVEKESEPNDSKTADLSSDDEVKKDSSKKKSKKHKKHKSKKKKKKKKKEKNEKRSKSPSSDEDQENASSETKSAWKPVISSPREEHTVITLSSQTEVNVDAPPSLGEGKDPNVEPVKEIPARPPIDIDSGFFGPKCPNEMTFPVSSVSLATSEVEMSEPSKEVAEPCLDNNEVLKCTGQDNEKERSNCEAAEAFQNEISLPQPDIVISEGKSIKLGESLNSEGNIDLLKPSDNVSQSKSTNESVSKSTAKSRSRSNSLARDNRSRSKSLPKVPKKQGDSKSSTRQRSRSSSAVRRQRSRSRSFSRRRKSKSPVRRRRSRSSTSARYSKSPIRSWWSKSIKNRERSVSIERRRRSRTRSLAKRRRSRSKSSEKRRYSRTASSAKRIRSGSRSANLRKSRSTSQKRRLRSRSGSRRKSRSKSRSPSRKRRSKSVSPLRRRRSRISSPIRRRKSRSRSTGQNRRSRSGIASRRRRSRSDSESRRRKSRSGSFTRRGRSGSATRRRRSTSRRLKSRSGSAFRRRRSRSAVASRRRRSRSPSVTRRRRSKSASVSRRRRSRSPSASRRRRSGSTSASRRRRSRSPSLSRRRRSKSPSIPRRRRSRSPSGSKRRRSRSLSASRRRRSRSPSVSRRRRSRSASVSRRRRSQSTSASRRRRTRSVSKRRKSRSISASRRRRSRSASRRRRSRSASRRRRSRSTSKRHRSSSISRRRRSKSNSVTRRRKSRTGSDTRRPRSRSGSGTQRQKSISTTNRTSRSPSVSRNEQSYISKVQLGENSKSSPSLESKEKNNESGSVLLKSKPGESEPVLEPKSSGEQRKSETMEVDGKPLSLSTSTAETIDTNVLTVEKHDGIKLPEVRSASVTESNATSPEAIENENAIEKESSPSLASPNIAVLDDHAKSTFSECPPEQIIPTDVPYNETSSTECDMDIDPISPTHICIEQPADFATSIELYPVENVNNKEPHTKMVDLGSADGPEQKIIGSTGKDATVCELFGASQDSVQLHEVSQQESALTIKSTEFMYSVSLGDHVPSNSSHPSLSTVDRIPHFTDQGSDPLCISNLKSTEQSSEIKASSDLSSSHPLPNFIESPENSEPIKCLKNAENPMESVQSFSKANVSPETFSKNLDLSSNKQENILVNSSISNESQIDPVDNSLRSSLTGCWKQSAEQDSGSDHQRDIRNLKSQTLDEAPPKISNEAENVAVSSTHKELPNDNFKETGKSEVTHLESKRTLKEKTLSSIHMNQDLGNAPSQVEEPKEMPVSSLNKTLLVNTYKPPEKGMVDVEKVLKADDKESTRMEEEFVSESVLQSSSVPLNVGDKISQSQEISSGKLDSSTKISACASEEKTVCMPVLNSTSEKMEEQPYNKILANATTVAPVCKPSPFNSMNDREVDKTFCRDTTQKDTIPNIDEVSSKTSISERSEKSHPSSSQEIEAKVNSGIQENAFSQNLVEHVASDAIVDKLGVGDRIPQRDAVVSKDTKSASNDSASENITNNIGEAVNDDHNRQEKSVKSLGSINTIHSFTEVKQPELEESAIAANYSKGEPAFSALKEIQKYSMLSPKAFLPDTGRLPVPLQFKFSKTFKTLGVSQLCSASEDSSDVEVSKVSNSSNVAPNPTLSTSGSQKSSSKTSPELHTARQSGSVSSELSRSSQDAEASKSDHRSGQRSDNLQSTDDSQTDSSVKPFPHISNAVSKLGVKQRHYRSRSEAQHSRSPSVDRGQGSRSRSKSLSRRRRSHSKSSSRKKRSQSTSRKKSSHSKSVRRKRSRSRSRGRKRRSQSKSKGKKKRSTSKVSGKRKRSRSKSSEKITGSKSTGKLRSSRSRSKTRKNRLQSKSPEKKGRSRSKSESRKNSRSKTASSRKRSRSKSTNRRRKSHSKSLSSRSRSRSASRKHISHSKSSVHRKRSHSSSRSASPRRLSRSRNKRRSFSRSPAARSNSRSRSRWQRSRSRGRWCRSRSLSTSRRRSRSLSTKKKKSLSPVRRRRSRSQIKQKDKSPVSKRKSSTPPPPPPPPQKKSTLPKPAGFKHSIGLKSLIQKQLSQAKSQGSTGKLSKEQLPLTNATSRAQSSFFSSRTQASLSNLSNIGQIPVPNLAEVPLPSVSAGSQVHMPSIPHSEHHSVSSLAAETQLSVPDLTTASQWHVPDMSGGAAWSVPDIAAGTHWSMTDLGAGAQWPMSDLTAGSHWPMHDMTGGMQWSMPDLAPGTQWAVPDVATGAQWAVPDLAAGTQWTVPDLTAGSQWAMANMHAGAQWAVPDLTAAQWTVPDLTAGAHMQRADLAPEAQVPGSDLALEAQVPGSDLGAEAQVPGSDLAAEAQVPGSDMVAEAHVPPEHELPSEHSVMPDVAAEALVPVASSTVVPDVAAGIPLPDVTAAAHLPVPDVAATVHMPDVATEAEKHMAKFSATQAYMSLSPVVSVEEPCYEEPNSASSEQPTESDSGAAFVQQTSFEPSVETSQKIEETLSTVQEAPLDLDNSPSTESDNKTKCDVELTQDPVVDVTIHPPQVEPTMESESCVDDETSKLSGVPSASFESTAQAISVEPNTTSEHNLMDCQKSSDSSLQCEIHSCSNNVFVESQDGAVQTGSVDASEKADQPLLAVTNSTTDSTLEIEENNRPEETLMEETITESVCSTWVAPHDSPKNTPQIEPSVNSSTELETDSHVSNLDKIEAPKQSLQIDPNLCPPQPPEHFASPQPTQLVEPYTSPAHPHLVESYSSPVHPQLVEPYSSPQHSTLVEPYSSPQHSTLVEPYSSPQHSTLVEPYSSPQHSTLVEPYSSPQHSTLVEPYSSPQHSTLVEPYSSPQHSTLVEPCSSPQHSTLVEPCSSPQHSTLVEPCSSPQHSTLVEPCSSPQHSTLVEPCSSPQHSTLVEPCSSPQHSMLVEPYSSPQHSTLVEPYCSPDRPQLVEPYASPEFPQLVEPYASPDGEQLVEPYADTARTQICEPVLTENSCNISEIPHDHSLSSLTYATVTYTQINTESCSDAAEVKSDLSQVHEYSTTPNIPEKQNEAVDSDYSQLSNSNNANASVQEVPSPSLLKASSDSNFSSKETTAEGCSKDEMQSVELATRSSLEPSQSPAQSFNQTIDSPSTAQKDELFPIAVLEPPNSRSPGEPKLDLSCATTSQQLLGEHCVTDGDSQLNEQYPMEVSQPHKDSVSSGEKQEQLYSMPLQAGENLSSPSVPRIDDEYINVARTSFTTTEQPPTEDPVDQPVEILPIPITSNNSISLCDETSSCIVMPLPDRPEEEAISEYSQSEESKATSECDLTGSLLATAVDKHIDKSPPRPDLVVIHESQDSLCPSPSKQLSDCPSGYFSEKPSGADQGTQLEYSTKPDKNLNQTIKTDDSSNITVENPLAAETTSLSADLPCINQEKLESSTPNQASDLSADCKSHKQEESSDCAKTDNHFTTTPPDLLPYDSYQPTDARSEPSSEQISFNSQPPPELLPYDSEQPASSFQNTCDYSAEQSSSDFHAPPELLPYDSDQPTVMHNQQPIPTEDLPVYDSTTVPLKTCISLDLPSVSTVDNSKDASVTRNEIQEKCDISNETVNTQSGFAEEVSSECTIVEVSTTEQAFISETSQELSVPSAGVDCSQGNQSSSWSSAAEVLPAHRPAENEEPEVQPEHLASSCENQTEQPQQLTNISAASDTQYPSSYESETSSLVPSVQEESSLPKSVENSECPQPQAVSKQTDPISELKSKRESSRSRSIDRKKSRSKSASKTIKRSRSKSATKSHSKSLVRSRRTKSRSASPSVVKRKESTVHKRSSRSPSVGRRRRSRSSSLPRGKRSQSSSNRKAHRRRSQSQPRQSRSPSKLRKQSRSPSLSRRKRSRSASAAHKRRSPSATRKKSSPSPATHKRRSPSANRRRRSPSATRRRRSSSVTRRRRSRSSSVTRRRRSRSPSTSRRRRSPSTTRRRRSPSASRRRRSPSPSASRRRHSPSPPATRRRRSRSPSATRRRRSPSTSASRRRRSPSTEFRRKRSPSLSVSHKRHSHSPSVPRKRRSHSTSVSRRRRSRSASQRKRSRSPSAQRKRRSKSKSPSKSPTGKRTKSDRSRSPSQSEVSRKRKTRSRSSSRDKKTVEKRRKRSSSKDSSKDYYSGKQRRKSRTPSRRKKSRSPSRRASVCKSPVRRRRSRSPVRRKSFSRSPIRRKRSRSRDKSLDSARSPKRLTDLDKAQLLEIAKANAAAMCAKAGVPLPPSLKPAISPAAPMEDKITHRTYGVTIQELTEKCKQIAQSKEDDVIVNKPHDSDDEEEDRPFYNHPFKVSEHKPISFSLLNPSLKPAPKNQVTLTKEFPVSSGSQHRKKESDKVYGEWVPVDKNTEEAKDDVFTNTAPAQPVDITSAMNERAVAQTRLTGNPYDLEALFMLNRAQEQIDAWAQSTSIPGQFTGSTGAQVLSAEEISNSGPQAWLKKDQFLKAAPVSGGRGALLMRKMGWKEGEGLGRNNEGNVDPILLDFKTDRKGLVADGEKASNKLALPAMKDLSGKHPISALMELCNKKKWSPPEFELVDDTGPEHRKRFLFRVTVNGVLCQPSQPSVNKKLAKAHAAAAALQALGALPKESMTSTTNFCSASSSTL
ncbi:protein SON isoform X2 [Engystomops pustulosus]|uniref:protein SON isoform X2 n=1 Tax=Engystomops pustulosus TaxID=76066 RepID=UPI003AFA7E54